MVYILSSSSPIKILKVKFTRLLIFYLSMFFLINELKLHISPKHYSTRMYLISSISGTREKMDFVVIQLPQP